MLEHRGFKKVIHPEPRPIPPEVAVASNAFAIDLYKRIAEDDGNVVFSPVSAYAALSMLYEGARGETAAEIRDTLGLIEDDGTRHQAMRNTTSLLNRHDPYSVLEVANSLWVAEKHAPQKQYADTVRGAYGADIEFVDKDGTAGRMNGWVDENTRGKIPDVLDPGDVDDGAGAALLGVAYFDGDWIRRFNPIYNQELNFWNGKGNVAADFMSHSCPWEFGINTDAQKSLNRYPSQPQSF